MRNDLEEFRRQSQQNMARMLSRNYAWEKKEILFGLGIIESPTPEVTRLVRDERKLDQACVRESQKESNHVARLLKERKALSEYAKTGIIL